MQKNKIELLPPVINIDFLYKNAEVAIDPTNKFYQVTFQFDYEKEVYEFINNFVNLVFSSEGFKDFGALPYDKNMVGFFFNVYTEFNDINWQRFSEWYYSNKNRLSLKTRNIVLNAINQEKVTKIKDLEFFTWVAVITLFSNILEEYFFKHFEKFNVIKDTLLILLGEIFEIILREIFDDAEINKIRIEKTGADKNKIKPLINKYLIIYNDIADLTSIEKMIFSKDKDFFIDKKIFSAIFQNFEIVLSNSKKFLIHGNLKNILSNINLIKLILSDKRDKKIFIKNIKKDKDLKEYLIVKYEKSIILNLIKDIIKDTGSSELINFIKHENVIEDMFYDNKVRNYLKKILKPLLNKKVKELWNYVWEATDRVTRSKNTFFNTIHKKEFEKILDKILENFSKVLSVMNNFNIIRQKYGKRTRYRDEMLGIKILRQSIIKIFTENNREKVECQMISDDQKTRIENMYEEGNLFYVREKGDFYSGMQERSGRKKFYLFADLRNFTETTMKLTKDTASFLTPYLNSVYKISKENDGTEIYFAGDGYASHFNKITDAIRTAYLIQFEFYKLRKEAEEKIRDKEKSILSELLKNGIIDTNKEFTGKKIDEKNLKDEIKEILKIISKNKEINIDTVVRKIAEENSMPSVEIGIGITEGELFVAVIGEENVKFTIVLSPSLNQAARLSGSNPEVKEYVEGLYGIKNLPKKVFTHKKKLFNQGIVITRDVYNTLRNEVEVFFVEKEKINLSYDIYYYFDKKLEKFISMMKLEEGVILKGIKNEIEIFEIFSPATTVCSYIDNWISNNRGK